MNRLVRLYPAAWRERYGDEMEALLEERPLGPFDVVDLLLGALDAHLHLRGLGHASEHEKGITMSLRNAGIAAIVGGLLFILMAGMLAIEATSDETSPITFALALAGSLTLLVAVTGLSAFQTRRYRSLIWLSFALVAFGLLSFVAAILASASGIGEGGLGWNLVMIGWFTIPAGSVLFGLATLRTGAFSRLASWAIIGGPVVMLLASLVTIIVDWGNDNTYLALNLAGFLAFSGSWIPIGVEAVRRDPAQIVAETPAG